LSSFIVILMYNILLNKLRFGQISSSVGSGTRWQYEMRKWYEIVKWLGNPALNTRDWCHFPLLRKAWRLLLVWWAFPRVNTIYFSKLANDIKVWGSKVNKYIISSKTANFDAKTLNLVIFFRSSEFFCESSDFLPRSPWQHCNYYCLVALLLMAGRTCYTGCESSGQQSIRGILK